MSDIVLTTNTWYELGWAASEEFDEGWNMILFMSFEGEEDILGSLREASYSSLT